MKQKELIMSEYLTSFGTKINLITGDEHCYSESMTVDIDAATMGETLFGLEKFPQFASVDGLKATILGFITNDASWKNPYAVVPMSVLTTISSSVSCSKKNDINIIKVSCFKTNTLENDTPAYMRLRVLITSPLK